MYVVKCVLKCKEIPAATMLDVFAVHSRLTHIKKACVYVRFLGMMSLYVYGLYWHGLLRAPLVGKEIIVLKVSYPAKKP